LSGSAAGLRLLVVFFLAGLLVAPAFFFLPLGVAEGVFEGLGVGRRPVSSFSSSSSARADLDLLDLLAELFGFGVGESSSSDFGFAGVLDGLGVGVFFFFGEGVGVVDGDECREGRCFCSLGVSSSPTWACRNDAMNPPNVRPVTM
jgi:hypothetical protein